MSNEIYDLYVSKNSRFDSNNAIIQEELAEFLDKTSGLQEDLRRVEHVHIPSILSEDEYLERGSCVGLSAFKILPNTSALQDFFSTKNLLVVWRNNFPTKATSLSKAYKLKNQEPGSNQVTATFQEAATFQVAAKFREEAINTEESDDSPGELKKETELCMRAENELLDCQEKISKVADIINLNSKITWRLREEKDEFSEQVKSLRSDKLKIESVLEESNEEILLLRKENEQLHKKGRNCLKKGRCIV
ncbi:hypothetical protein BpHYR1_006061 [Brachionus plicatilis]|uniref:Uncharacterized protein n=1 Tax=Brachionus plicatilis TaxID=10195 RepID=A0A3M7RCX0_BRAPC|nr:hypothetical protein BpHYR1_006061 [Brachionus plicatilis]